MLGRLAALREGDGRAAFHVDARVGDGLAGQHGVDRLGGLRDRAVIGDLEAGLRLDDEDFAFALDAELFADELQLVHQDGHRELLRLGLGGGRFARLAEVRVHHVEEDALVLVGGLDLGQLGRAFARDLRAVGLRHHDDGRGVAEVEQLVREARGVGQLEVADLLRDEARRRGRGGDHAADACDGDDGGKRSRHQDGFHSSSPPEPPVRSRRLRVCNSDFNIPAGRKTVNAIRPSAGGICSHLRSQL